MLCTFYDEEDCRFHFVYTDKDDIKVRAQKERECPPKVFILGIILGVIAAIVLIGLAILLLWKLLTTISDRREFAKFEKERMMAKWDTVSWFNWTNWSGIMNYFPCRERIQFTSKPPRHSRIPRTLESKESQRSPCHFPMRIESFCCSFTNRCTDKRTIECRRRR